MANATAELPSGTDSVTAGLPHGETVTARIIPLDDGGRLAESAEAGPDSGGTASVATVEKPDVSAESGPDSGGTASVAPVGGFLDGGLVRTPFDPQDYVDQATYEDAMVLYAKLLKYYDRASLKR